MRPYIGKGTVPARGLVEGDLRYPGFPVLPGRQLYPGPKEVWLHVERDPVGFVILIHQGQNRLVKGIHRLAPDNQGSRPILPTA